MAGNKYIKNYQGTLTEQAGTQVGGTGYENQIPALDNTGRLDATMMPVGVVPEVVSMPTSENLTAGDFVNIYSNGGTATARKADATTSGKECFGYVLESTTAPATAKVYTEGANTQVVGATPGLVFLSTTAGGFTSTAPSSAGNSVQRLGVATSATTINFEPQQPITLA